MMAAAVVGIADAFPDLPIRQRVRSGVPVTEA
jgi:hypothetical protein